MSGLENSNGSIRGRIALLLRSKLTAFSFLLRKSKLRLSLAGVVALASVPVAVLGVQGFSGASDTSANLNTQPAVSETPSAPAQTPVSEQVVPSAAATSPSGGAQNQTSATTQVTVNGESVPVPENGSVHKTIDTGNGGQVTVNVDNNTTTASPGNSYTNVQSFSSSASSSVNVNQSTNIGGTSP